MGQDRSVLGIRYFCIGGYWEFGHDVVKLMKICVVIQGLFREG